MKSNKERVLQLGFHGRSLLKTEIERGQLERDKNTNCFFFLSQYN